MPPILKPKDMPKRTHFLLVRPDGREILQIKYYAVAKAAYRQRVEAMWERQQGICCLDGYCPTCPGYLRLSEATFEHENGRAGGKRDDRIELPDGTWINGAAHAWCNAWKGSRYIDYNRRFQNAERW